MFNVTLKINHLRSTHTRRACEQVSQRYKIQAIDLLLTVWSEWHWYKLI